MNPQLDAATIARVKARWDRFNGFVSDFLHAARQLGQPWKEPHVSLDDDCLPSGEWFGNGPQGSEPARMLVTMDDDDETPVALVCARDEPDDFARDGLATYLRYLEINGWLVSTSASPTKGKP